MKAKREMWPFQKTIIEHLTVQICILFPDKFDCTLLYNMGPHYYDVLIFDIDILADYHCEQK